MICATLTLRQKRSPIKSVMKTLWWILLRNKISAVSIERVMFTEVSEYPPKVTGLSTPVSSVTRDDLSHDRDRLPIVAFDLFLHHFVSSKS